MKNCILPSRHKSEYTRSQNLFFFENALATLLFMLGTGNFLAGYLAYLGAPPAYCALIGAMPQLGCVLQLLSPFFFERLRHRKALICICCFAFRFGMGIAGLLPFLLPDTSARLTAVFILYLLAFLMAGFVTPGLNQWIMELAPTERRGSYFAKKDIISALFTSCISLLIGHQLDHFTATGRTTTGYLVLFSSCCVLALVDQLLMHRIEEVPHPTVPRLHPADLARPLKDAGYRRIVHFLLLWFFSVNFSSAFLPVYMLQVLGMSHTAITGVNVVAGAVGVVGTWLWGRIADHTSWNRVLMLAGSVIGGAYFCWAFVGPQSFTAAPFFLQAAIAGCSSAFNMASLNLQYSCCPKDGKTIYLGVCAACSNLVGYFAAATSAALQSQLMAVWGASSIAVLFAISGILCLGTALLFSRRLPQASRLS